MSTLDPIFGCIISSGRLDKDGYAFTGKTRAHIAAWTAVNGPVPDGLVLDHLCGNRACRAVHHLEPVTQSENLKRRDRRYRNRIKKCPRGHDMAINAVTTMRGRVCRTCNREAGGVQ